MHQLIEPYLEKKAASLLLKVGNPLDNDGMRIA